MADIAARAGVTKAAVSFALNGQPGVSAATRERILAIAQEVGFQPNSAARALTAGRVGAFGLIIDRPARLLSIEPFFMQLLSGIQADLTQHHVTLAFSMAEDTEDEIALYEQWWAQRHVDGVFVVDLQHDDRRIPVLERLRMPAVVLGPPGGSGTLPAIWQDVRTVVEVVVGHLAGLGHQRIARVGGLSRYWHTTQRAAAFAEAAAMAGMEAVQAEADYSAEHGAEATRELLRDPRPPTAILYDNDVMAVAGLSAAQRLGVSVPADLSIVSWDDSALCELTHPAITSVGRDIAGVGAMAARMLREMVEGQRPRHAREPAEGLRARGSTGPVAVRPADPQRVAGLLLSRSGSVPVRDM
jgi:DNA-binding LacI/PurR family transcriptional regulator